MYHLIETLQNRQGQLIAVFYHAASEDPGALKTKSEDIQSRAMRLSGRLEGGSGWRKTDHGERLTLRFLSGAITDLHIIGGSAQAIQPT